MTLAQFILIRKVSRIIVVFIDHMYTISTTLRAHVPFVIQQHITIITSSFAIKHHTSLFTQVLSGFLHALFDRRYL